MSPRTSRPPLECRVGSPCVDCKLEARSALLGAYHDVTDKTALDVETGESLFKGLVAVKKVFDMLKATSAKYK